MTKHTDTGRRTAVPLIEKIARTLEAQMETQADDTTPSSIHRQQGRVWLDGWFDLSAALTAIMGDGDGVQQCDREAAADLYLDQIGDEDGFADRIRANTAQPGCDAWEQAFARHRSTAAAAERARIVASLRDTPWPYRNDALADAIERGEV